MSGARQPEPFPQLQGVAGIDPRRRGTAWLGENLHEQMVGKRSADRSRYRAAAVVKPRS